MLRFFLILMALVSQPSLAATQPPDNPTWRAECGACHIPYPPRMLSAAAWRKVMSGLAQHFGDDASLSDSERQDITRWLVNHAGPADTGRATDRITETAHFRHEHHELSAKVWSRPGVGSRANCQSCHRDAERGRFDERQVRIPR